MLECVILGTSHEVQETPKFQKLVADAIRKHPVRLIAEEHPLDTISPVCGAAKHLHIPYLQIDPFPHEWVSLGIDREMRSREQFLQGRDVRLSHADDVRENWWLDKIEASVDSGRVLVVCGCLHADFLADKVRARGGMVVEKIAFPPELAGKKPGIVLDRSEFEDYLKKLS